MFRFACVLMVAGLFAALGCERKPEDRPAKKVTGEDVRRDAGQAVKTAAEYSQQTTEEVRKKLDKEPAAQPPVKVTPVKVAPKNGGRDPGQAAYYKEMKAEFQKKLEAKLDELDGKIIMLRAKGRNLEGTARASWDQKMAELDVKRDAARAKLNKVVDSSAEAWDDVKRGAESAWDDLDQAFRDATKVFSN
jgi:hypothetical protein